MTKTFNPDLYAGSRGLTYSHRRATILVGGAKLADVPVIAYSNGEYEVPVKIINDYPCKTEINRGA